LPIWRLVLIKKISMNSIKKILLIAATLIGGAANAQDIVIGQVVPLTGTQAATGIAARDGAQLYFDKINRHGGIQGRKIVLDVRDDEYQTAKTVNLVREIIREHSPVLMISAIGAAGVEALIKEKVLENGKVSLLGPTSGARMMYGVPRIYPVRASYEREANKFLAQFKSTGVKRLAVVYQDDAFGKEGLASIQEFLKSSYKDVQLVASASYSRTDTDLAKQATEVSKSDPQAVLLYAVTKPAASFIQHFKPLAPKATIAMMSSVELDSLIKEGGNAVTDSLIGLFLPHPNNKKELLVREMHEDAKELGRSVNISPRFQLGYTTARVAVSVMQSIKGPITAVTLDKALDDAKSFKLSDTLEVRNEGKNQGINFVDFGIIGRAGLIY